MATVVGFTGPVLGDVGSPCGGSPDPENGAGGCPRHGPQAPRTAHTPAMSAGVLVVGGADHGFPTFVGGRESPSPPTALRCPSGRQTSAAPQRLLSDAARSHSHRTTRHSFSRTPMTRPRPDPHRDQRRRTASVSSRLIIVKHRQLAPGAAGLTEPRLGYGSMFSWFGHYQPALPGISGVAAMAWPVHRPSVMRHEQPAFLDHGTTRTPSRSHSSLRTRSIIHDEAPTMILYHVAILLTAAAGSPKGRLSHDLLPHSQKHRDGSGAAPVLPSLADADVNRKVAKKVNNSTKHRLWCAADHRAWGLPFLPRPPANGVGR